MDTLATPLSPHLHADHAHIAQLGSDADHTGQLPAQALLQLKKQRWVGSGLFVMQPPDGASCDQPWAWQCPVQGGSAALQVSSPLDVLPEYGGEVALGDVSVQVAARVAIGRPCFGTVQAHLPAAPTLALGLARAVLHVVYSISEEWVGNLRSQTITRGAPQQVCHRPSCSMAGLPRTRILGIGGRAVEPVVGGDFLDGIARAVSGQNVALVGELCDVLVAAQQGHQRQRQPRAVKIPMKAAARQECGCASVGPRMSGGLHRRKACTALAAQPAACDAPHWLLQSGISPAEADLQGGRGPVGETCRVKTPYSNKRKHMPSQYR